MSGSDSPAPDDVYLRALNLLARRDHSVAELRRKLSARGASESLVADALERLRRQGYLDDRRFAEHWTESALRGGRGFGVRLLLELQRRGVDRETAAGVVAEASAEHGEQRVLAAVVAKRFSAFDPVKASQKERQRVYAYLQRRGFSISAIRAYFNGSPEED